MTGKTVRWRALMIFALGAMIEALCLFAQPLGMGPALSIYFEALNLSYRTVASASGWLRFLYMYSDALGIFLVGGVLWGVSHMFPWDGTKKPGRKYFLKGLLAGALIAVFMVALLTAVDAMRVAGSIWRPQLRMDQLFSAALVFAVMAGCEGMERGWLREALHRAGFGKSELWVLPLWAAALRILIGTSVLQAVNAALLALLLTLAARVWSSIWPGAAFRFTLTWVASGLLGAPEGGMYGLRALYEIYPVSSHWLTGGARGLDAGALYTIILLLLMLLIKPINKELRGVLPCGEWIARWTGRRRTKSSKE